MVTSSVTNIKEKFLWSPSIQIRHKLTRGIRLLSTFSAALVKIQIEWKNVDSGNTLLTSISLAIHVGQNLAIARQSFILADKQTHDSLKSSSLDKAS
jgi:hypothetical protein